MRHKAAASLAQGYDPGSMLQTKGAPFKRKRAPKRWMRLRYKIKMIEEKLALSGLIAGQRRTDLLNQLVGLRLSDSEKKGGSLHKDTRRMKLASGKRKLATPLKKLGEKRNWRPKWKTGGRIVKRSPVPTESMQVNASA